MTEPQIRAARADEARLLSALAIRSKGHWGYSVEFMQACREELTISGSQITNDGCLCYVAATGDTILGYYALRAQSGDVYELDALFVDPPYIGTGIGRSLLQHAAAALAERGASRMVIQGDPNAVAFYEAAGAVQIGTRESESISGRLLPLFELAIS